MSDLLIREISYDNILVCYARLCYATARAARSPLMVRRCYEVMRPLLPSDGMLTVAISINCQGQGGSLEHTSDTVLHGLLNPDNCSGDLYCDYEDVFRACLNQICSL